VCTGCSRGCNIFVDWETKRSYKESGRRIQRLKPRYNRLVNEWWMCDRGRYSYHPVDAPNRLQEPLTKSEGDLRPAAFEQVIARVAAKLEAAIEQHGADSVAVLATAHASNEDLFMLKRLFVDRLQTQHLDVTLTKEVKGREDEILMKADLAPNRRGALELGVKPWGGDGMEGDAILEAAVEGEFEVLIVVDHDLTDMLPEKSAVKLRKHTDYIVYVGAHKNAMAELADDVLPMAMWAEKRASFTNFQGRVQRTGQPFAPLGFALPEWQIWQALSTALGHKREFESVDEVFDAIGESVEAFKGLTWESLGSGGRMLTTAPEPYYRKVQTKQPLPAY
jgi:NADH-quinone oxidoreductase subunit G